MNPVTAVLITYNEAHNLIHSLPKLHWCDEIVVIDSGSTDNTKAICERFSCKIFERKFDGYGTQKQFGVSCAKNHWIILLDADEVLTDELIDEIKLEMQSPSANGYYLPIVFVFMGKPFLHGRESKAIHLRLFNRKYGNVTSAAVHEGVLVTGPTKKLRNPFYHYSYRNTSHYFEKFNRYSSLGAEKLFAQHKKRPLPLIFLTVPFKFFHYYFIDRNILNGLPGFYWSMFNAFYHLVKYTKLRERYGYDCGDSPVSPITHG